MIIIKKIGASPAPLEVGTMLDRRVHPRGGTALGWEALEYSLQFLMTRFARSRDPRVAHMVVEHLEMLLGHPRIRDDETGLRELYTRLLGHWRELSTTGRSSGSRASPAASGGERPTAPGSR